MANGQPSLVGDIQMDRGSLEFFGATFDISNGKLTFVGENYVDPQLEVQAVRRTGKYGDVGAAVTGTVSSFQVEFKSDDYPDQTDILSILLFGKPASELGDSEGQAGGSQLGAALSMAAGSQLNSALGSTFNGQVEFDGGALKVGIPLSDKYFLTIERNAAAEDDDNIMSVSLEWLISRQMYAEMVTGDKGQSSADLYMRWLF
jgi:autotransporter translocation and assembly factor TamB